MAQPRRALASAPPPSSRHFRVFAQTYPAESDAEVRTALRAAAGHLPKKPDRHPSWWRRAAPGGARGWRARAEADLGAVAARAGAGAERREVHVGAEEKPLYRRMSAVLVDLAQLAFCVPPFFKSVAWREIKSVA